MDTQAGCQSPKGINEYNGLAIWIEAGTTNEIDVSLLKMSLLNNVCDEIYNSCVQPPEEMGSEVPVAILHDPQVC